MSAAVFCSSASSTSSSLCASRLFTAVTSNWGSLAKRGPASLRVHASRTSVSASTSRPSQTRKPSGFSFPSLFSRSNSAASRVGKVMASSDVSSTIDQSKEVEDEAAFWQRISSQQKSVPKLALVEESRTILEELSCGFLSTISKKYDDHPFGSMVGYASDDDGNIILSISSLSLHTADLERNPKCSFLLSRNPMDKGESVITVVGNALKVPEGEIPEVRKQYLEKHPDAFWVDFGDFQFVKIHPTQVRYVGNIASFTVGASVAEFNASEFKEAKPDPISKFSLPVSKHMNEDHEDAIVAIVNHALNVQVSSAKILTVDRFGMSIQTKLKDRESRIRVGFSRPAESRKDIKDLIVELTREAKTAKAASEGQNSPSS